MCPQLPPKLLHAIISAAVAFLTALGCVAAAGCGTLHLHQPASTTVATSDPAQQAPQDWSTNQ